MTDATNADTQTAGNATPDAGTTDPNLLTQQTDQTGATAPAQDGQTEGNTGQTDTKDAQPVGAPEKYEFRMPDGMQVDQQALGQFEPLARMLGLNNAQAQQLVDVYARQVQSASETLVNERVAWQQAVVADKEIGGAAYDTSIRHAQAAIRKFGTTELGEVLDVTGLGNNPEVVRLMARIGKAMAEDQFIQTDHTSSGRIDPARVLFPSMS